jgi:hypothetical protein
MALSHSPQIIRDGLVLYLDPANIKSYPGSGTSWFDLINNRTCTLSNGPSFNNENKGVFSFDGVDDFSVISSVNLLGLTSITINMWYYSNVNTSTALTRSSSTGNSFLLHFRGAGFYIVTNDGNNSGYLGWQTLPNGLQWNMLTATWNGSIMKLYINGIKQNNERSYIGSGVLANINTIQLGYNFNSGQPFTNGKIGIFQIYNKELTNDEIKQNFETLRGRYQI